MVNPRYFAAYDPKYGFRFVVERLHNLSLKQPHIVITSISPPGSLYKNPPKRT